MWEVVTTGEFRDWWSGLPAESREAIWHDVRVLEIEGPRARRPVVDSVKGSRHANLKELRTRVGPNQYRVFFAFDPSRRAVLLIGGDKSGDARFYERMIRLADHLYDRHIGRRSDREGSQE
jgi:hypothetical protein